MLIYGGGEVGVKYCGPPADLLRVAAPSLLHYTQRAIRVTGVKDEVW